VPDKRAEARVRQALQDEITAQNIRLVEVTATVTPRGRLSVLVVYQNIRLSGSPSRRLARGVSTWAIVVQATGPNQAGPFRLDTSPLNATPFGTLRGPGTAHHARHQVGPADAAAALGPPR
jgi:hypothetical protein